MNTVKNKSLRTSTEVILKGSEAASVLKILHTDRELIERYMTAQIPEAVTVYGIALKDYPFNNV